MKSKAVRKAIDKVRQDNGLAVYDKPLIAAKCEDPKCGRVFYWRQELVPEVCSWPGCHGKVKAI